jgi:hypothetical protein
MATDSKSSSFPTPWIASSKTETESLDLEDIDMSQDGVQENVVVTKGGRSACLRRAWSSSRPNSKRAEPICGRSFSERASGCHDPRFSPTELAYFRCAMGVR